MVNFEDRILRKILDLLMLAFGMGSIVIYTIGEVNIPRDEARYQPRERWMVVVTSQERFGINCQRRSALGGLAMLAT